MSSSTGAEVRAPLSKAVLELLDRQPRGVRDAVRLRAAEAVRAVEDASRVGYVPLGVQLRILRELHDVVGLAGYEEFCAKHFSSTVEQPLVKTVFDGTVRLFGMGPGPVFRMFPKSWAMLARGAGTVQVVGEPDSGRVELRVIELPMEEPEIDLYVKGFCATFRGVLDMFDQDGEVELVQFDRAAATARYVVRWS